MAGWRRNCRGQIGFIAHSIDKGSTWRWGVAQLGRPQSDNKVMIGLRFRSYETFVEAREYKVVKHIISSSCIEYMLWCGICHCGKEPPIAYREEYVLFRVINTLNNSSFKGEWSVGTPQVPPWMEASDYLQCPHRNDGLTWAKARIPLGNEIYGNSLAHVPQIDKTIQADGQYKMRGHCTP